MPSVTFTGRATDPLGQTAELVASGVVESVVAGRWSNPATWPNGQVPGRDTDAVVPAGSTVVLDAANAEARMLTVRGTLVKLAQTDVRLTMFGNLVVETGGLVDFRPAAADDLSTWLVQFIVPTESQYVGGGNLPVASDIGWWTVGGRVNLAGAEKTSWSRLVDGVAAGDTLARVQDITGWRVGDEIAIGPNEPPVEDGSDADRFDVRAITEIVGNTLRLNAGLTFSHPVVAFPVFTDGVLQTRTFEAVVMNLTRTGRIEGRPGLRPHMFLRTTQPVAQSMRHVQFRHLGPRGRCDLPSNPRRCDDREPDVGVTGRWGGPHFHMNSDNSFGSIVEGCVVRDFGSHALIPHDSNGITLRRNVCYDGLDKVIWWDPPGEGGMQQNEPNRLVIEGNVVAKARGGGTGLLATTTAFDLGNGNHPNTFPNSEAANNICRDNVAVGIRGMGYEWPELSQGHWRFDRGNIAQNCTINGAFLWRNNLIETLDNFVVYYCGSGAILAGAYGNAYNYRNISLYGNAPGGAQFEMHAFSSLPPTEHVLNITNLYADGIGRAESAVRAFDPQDDFGTATLLVNGETRGHTRAAFIAGFQDPGTAVRWDVRDFRTAENRYWVESVNHPATEVIDRDLGLRLRRFDQAGTLRSEWNARVTPL